MMYLKRSYLILGLVSITFIGSSCQKAAPSHVKAKQGTVLAERNQDDVKIEKLIKDGKSVDVCPQGIVEKNSAFLAEIESTQNEIKNLKKTGSQAASADQSLAILKQGDQEADGADDTQNGENPKSGLSAEADKSLIAHSQQIKHLARALFFEFANQKIASCGKNESLIQVEMVRDKANESYIAIADARKADSPESLAARTGQKQKNQATNAADSEILLGLKFKIKKELIDVLDKENLANSLFITQGQKGSVLENYQIALNDANNGVCLLDLAPTEKLKDDSIVTIIKTDLVKSESLMESKDKKDAQKIDFDLRVKMGSGDLFFTFNCRLKSDLETKSVPSQFLEIFGSLIKRESESKGQEN